MKASTGYLALIIGTFVGLFVVGGAIGLLLGVAGIFVSALLGGGVGWFIIPRLLDAYDEAKRVEGK